MFEKLYVEQLNNALMSSADQDLLVESAFCHLELAELAHDPLEKLVYKEEAADKLRDGPVVVEKTHDENTLFKVHLNL